jgi:hypothetical protein
MNRMLYHVIHPLRIYGTFGKMEYSKICSTMLVAKSIGTSPTHLNMPPMNK